MRRNRHLGEDLFSRTVRPVIGEPFCEQGQTEGLPGKLQLQRQADGVIADSLASSCATQIEIPTSGCFP